jgi:hypothetical protein
MNPQVSHQAGIERMDDLRRQAGASRLAALAATSRRSASLRGSRRDGRARKRSRGLKSPIGERYA